MPFDVNRRQFVETLGALGVGLIWPACGRDTTTAAGGGAGVAGDPNATTGSGLLGTIDPARWARGGTQAMAASYPDPFVDAPLGSACTLTCSATEGPCLLADNALPPAREDVSEKAAGLPVHMGFRLVDAACKPLAGATVEIWHTDAEGVYSGKTPNTAFCSAGDQTAIAAQWFRGVQTTDADGTVFFRTCFPGWYASRTVHVHVRIRVGNTLWLTTQFFFDDAVTDAIVADQPLYQSRGARDTTNANDSVVSAAAAADYCFAVRQLDDGVMQASKTVVVLEPGTGTGCTIPGGSSGRGGGSGQPPGSQPPQTGRRRVRD